jgi:hypothetical protein
LHINLEAFVNQASLPAQQCSKESLKSPWFGQKRNSSYREKKQTTELLPHWNGCMQLNFTAQTAKDTKKMN